MSRISLGLLLLVMWVLLWGSVTVANVASGIAVVAAMYVVFPSARPYAPRVLVHPLPLLVLIAYFLRQVVVSNVVIAREIVSKRSRLKARLIDVPMRTSSPGFLTLMAYITALSPGTMAVRSRIEPPRITLHALVLHDVDDVSRNLWRLEELCVRAFGSPEAVAEIIGRVPDPASCVVRAAAVGDDDRARSDEREDR